MNKDVKGDGNRMYHLLYWPFNIPTVHSTGFTSDVLMSTRILPGSGFGEGVL